MHRVPWFVSSLCLLSIACAGAEPTHPWRPPFGLDRIGHSAQHEGLEAGAEVHPNEPVNPVDFGAILVPHGWLLLGPGQSATIEVVALSHSATIESGMVRAWFESNSDKHFEKQSRFVQGLRGSLKLPVPAPATSSLNDSLHVAILNEGVEVWHKTIPVMLVHDKPALPRFGAVELKLRYDLPISVNSGEGGKLGKLSFIKYEDGWEPKLNDVVVCLPNGSRFVFWRGSSYIPFWAGEHNTGLCYEWAETTPPPGGFVDSVEPLMDKELRYGRAQIVESTPSRIHVRWTYQSTDFQYRVWGDQAVEDFYFYPDGFGTRVLTLKRRPQADYELSEFIILSPPGAYPLEIVPPHAVEMLYLDGGKAELSFPPDAAGLYDKAKHRRPSPVVYSIKAHRDDRASAFYFHPSADHYPAFQFGPFKVGDQIVTPAYWGSHWPLSRGRSTGAQIDDRFALSPAHNSLLTWGMGNRPPPLNRTEGRTLDTLGESKEMLIERWAWLIAMTDANEARLLAWARSFSEPPAVKAEGAEVDFEGYAAERRAIRLTVSRSVVSLTIKPRATTIHPVFELTGAPKNLTTVEIDGRAVSPSLYTWDGATFWLDADVTQPAALKLQFRQSVTN